MSQDRFKITRELGKGAYGMIYQLQVTCDQETDVFASVKVAEPWATESLEAENLMYQHGILFQVVNETYNFSISGLLSGSSLLQSMGHCLVPTYFLCNAVQFHVKGHGKILR